MESKIRRKLEMAARVLDFAQAHPSTDASCNALVARLETQVKRGDALAVQQLDGIERESATVNRRLDLRRSMLRLQLRHLARMAELALPDHPELAGQFVVPRSDAPHQAFITSAKSMLAASAPVKDLFLSLGIGDTFFDDFTSAVNGFDAATEEAYGWHNGHVGARAELNSLSRSCVKLAGLLDGIYRARFRNDPEALAAWDSARIVIALGRSKKATAGTPAPAPSPSPSPVDGGAPPAPNGGMSAAA